MKKEGIVINSSTYKDNDLIVELLTKEGLVAFRSKGIKKIDAKNKSLVFDFACIDAEFYKKGEKLTLINGKNTINLNKLYSSFEGMIFISFIKESLHKMIVDEDKNLLYPYIIQSLKSIESCQENELKDTITQNTLHLLLKIGEIGGFGPKEYFENTSLKSLINYFLDFKIVNKEIEVDHTLKLIKKISYYLEEISDIKINSISLLQHL